MNESERFSPRANKVTTWQESVRLAIFSLALLLGLVGILSFQFLPGRYQLNEGDVSVFDIRSPAKVTYVSAIKTKEAKDQAAAAVLDLYTYNPETSVAQRQKASDFLRSVSDIRKRTAIASAKVDALKALSGVSLSSAVLDEMVSMGDTDWQSVTTESSRVLEVVMQRRIGYRDLADEIAMIPSMVSGQLSASQIKVVTETVQNFVVPNSLLDSEGTENAKREARDSVQPVRYTLEKGEMILREGDVVRPIHLEQLESAGLRNPTINWQYVLANGFLAAALVALLSLYLFFYRPVIVASERRLLLLVVVILAAVFFAKLVIPGREVIAYVYPAGAAAMLIATLLDADLAILSALVVAVPVGLISNSSMEMTALALVSGVVGTLGSQRVERLNSFFRTGAAVALANFVVVVGFQLSNGDVDLNRLGGLLFLAVGNGTACAVLTLGTFSVLGHIFGITTSVGLLELAHPTQPLFRRLLIEAPGTYHHSVVVANLSERAAQTVGADALLARVGGYYHDIGKVVHPYFFIENQLDGNNIHDRLDARTSVHSIAAHVTDGLTLARRNGLPSKVIDIIEQHHGTSLVRFFYHQACQENDGAVSPEDFSYPGPKPQTREAAIVMLADSVEARVRANRDHSAENIESLVNAAVADRLAEGQLDECDLTIRDLDLIKKAFALVLQGIFHPRITYPDTLTLPAAENKGQGEDENGKKGWSIREKGRSTSA